MADVCHNLRFGHFIGRFRRDEPGSGLIILESLLQFALGLARTKDQDLSGMTKMGNDLVIVARQMPGVLSLTRIIGRNCLVLKSAGGRLPGTPGLRFRTGVDPLCFFPSFRQDDDKGLSMVNPKTRFRFQTSTVVDLICVFHPRQGSGRTIRRIWGETPPWMIFARLHCGAGSCCSFAPSRCKTMASTRGTYICVSAGRCPAMPS